MARKSNIAKGKTKTVVMKRGPNKGETHIMKGSPSGKPFFVRKVKDKKKK